MQPKTSDRPDDATVKQNLLDAAQKLLNESTQIITSNGSLEYSDEDQDNFSNLRKSIMRCSGLKEEGHRLLSEVQSKEDILIYMISVYEKKTLYRKQVTALLSVLLQQESWRAVLEEQPFLRHGMPKELNIWISGDDPGSPDPAMSTVPYFENKAKEIAATRIQAVQRGRKSRSSLQSEGKVPQRKSLKSVRSGKQSQPLTLRSVATFQHREASMGADSEGVGPKSFATAGTATTLPSEPESVASLKIQAAFRGYSARKSVQSVQLAELQRRRTIDALKDADKLVYAKRHTRESLRIGVNRTTQKTVDPTKLGPVDMLQQELAVACEVFDAEAIKKGMQLSDELNIADLPLPKEAAAMYEQLTDPEAVLSMMQQQSKLLQGGASSELIVKRLQNLLRAGDNHVIISALAVADAKKELIPAVGGLLRQKVKDKGFSEIDVEEMKQLLYGFADVRAFTRLKPFEFWSGHTPENTGWFAKPEPDKEEYMLCYTTRSITAALSTVSDEHEGTARVSFSKMQTWMYDRPHPDGPPPESLVDDIVQAAGSNESLADEVYVQLMKQLTDNSKVASERQGWELMLQLCQQVRPSAELNIFLHSFLLRSIEHIDAAENPNLDLQVLARQCVVDANRTGGTGAGDIDLSVQLLGFGQRKLRVDPKLNLRQVRNLVAQQLGIEEPRDFQFFQVTQSVASHRLLSDQAVLSSMLGSFSKLEARSGKKSFLLFKRRLLYAEDQLGMETHSWHAALSYKQLVADFTSMPLAAEEDQVFRIAAAIWWADRIYYAALLKNPEEQIMPQLLPKPFLKKERREASKERVKHEFLQLCDTLPAKELLREGRCRVLEELQKLQLFGAYCWPVRQTELPAESILKTAPGDRECVALPGKTELHLCADWFSVRLVALGEQGELKVRTFTYPEGARGSTRTQPASRSTAKSAPPADALERVDDWGAQQALLQLLVTAVNPEDPHGGLTEMSIALATPAAVDIALVMEMLPIFRKEKQMRASQKSTKAPGGAGRERAGTQQSFTTSASRSQALAPRGQSVKQLAVLVETSERSSRSIQGSRPH